MRIAVIGAKGLLGSAIYKELSQNPKDTTTAVTRDNYADKQKQSFDVIINCAMPSARFWAKNNPGQDFIETVKKTADLLSGWQFKKFVQVSTVSARCQLDTVYGRHKLAAEKLCNFGDNLIIRLGAVYSPEIKKGVLVDMKEGKKVFVDGASRYCFASLDFVSQWVAANLDRRGIVEVGGKNAVALKEVAKRFGQAVEFEGAIDHQEIENPEPDFPEAAEVLTFVDKLKAKT